MRLVAIAMASERNKASQQDSNFDNNIEANLLSMEILDRESPELWPEKIEGVAEFINNYVPTTTKELYSKEISHEDNNYIHQLASLSTIGLIGKVKELHDIAYQLGLEESKEMTRGKYLNLFDRAKKKN